METTKKQKTIRLSIGVIISILLFFSPGIKIPALDTTTDVYFREAIVKAGVVYATCRAINASVSVVKDSSLQLQPAGVGVSLALGQVLDPIDDMTERLSDVLVTAITSLGVQKLVYEISISLAPPILSVFLFALSILLWFDNERLINFQKTIIHLILIIVIGRLCLPLSSIANEFINKHYFADQISEVNKELAQGSAELYKLTDFSLPEIDGVFGTIENSASLLKRKSIEFKNAVVGTVSHMKDLIENLLKLTFLYVGIFLIQVIILPLLSFWFLVKISNTFFLTNVPVVLQYDHPAKKE